MYHVDGVTVSDIINAMIAKKLFNHFDGDLAFLYSLNMASQPHINIVHHLP